MFNKIILCMSLLFASFGIASNSIASVDTDRNTETVKEVFVSSGDAKLFCRVIGKGKPLIVIHGGPGLCQDYLEPGMYTLAENNLLIFYDQRGCGKSTGSINADSISMESFVNDIEAIRKTFNFDKISILGHSWGGFVAMHYAIADQSHIDKLILSNSAPSTSEGYALFGKEYMRRMTPFQNQIDKLSDSEGFREGNENIMEQFYRLIFRQYCYNPEKAELLNLRMASTATLDGRKVSGILRENVLDKPFDLNKGLNTLKISTLIIHGDSDPIPLITVKEVHENISGSKLILMKDCGHFPYVEDPSTYFKHIDAFLNSKP